MQTETPPDKGEKGEKDWKVFRKRNEIIKSIVRKIDMKEGLGSQYAHFSDVGSQCTSGQKSIQCAIAYLSRRVMDLTGFYRYCEICDDIKYHVDEETNRHQVFIGCLGC